LKSFEVDITTRQFSKKGEDICGDAIKVTHTPDSTVIVLSDGLGSGVKANVLATLTVELATGLFQGDLSLHEIIETLIATLPVCKWRNIAYSTFSIVRIYDTGHVTIAEYDSPTTIYLRRGSTPRPITSTERTICDKTIRESYFKMFPGDALMLYSDGIVYAGVGEGLRMGWQEEGVLDYVSEVAPAACGSTKKLASMVEDRALSYWAERPGDDGTVLCAKYRKARIATVLTGPPADRAERAPP
jgi:serine phosphatase RsbU (regulator of sigma subunit)